MLKTQICLSVPNYSKRQSLKLGNHPTLKHPTNKHSICHWFKERTAASLVNDWNANLEAAIAEVNAHNADLIERYQAGNLHPNALEAGLEPMPKRLKAPSRSWGQWFRQTWGWSMLTRSNDSQAYLPYNHPDMECARVAVKALVSEQNVNGALILNYDQPAASAAQWANIIADDEDAAQTVPASLEECHFVVYVKEKKESPVPVELMAREAFSELASRGLTDVPPLQHCGIYFHRTTQQWHARYGHSGEKNSAPTYNENLRSEKKAIVMAFLGMWRWYANETNASADSKQVALLEKELASIPF
eukprot:Skav221646  [mRNA]  locus=scaffold1174:172793:177119:+ [translate_table: standard]